MTFYCFFAGLVNFMLIIMFQCMSFQRNNVPMDAMQEMTCVLFFPFPLLCIVLSFSDWSIHQEYYSKQYNLCVYICIKFEEFTPVSCPECNLMRRWVNKQNPQSWKVHHCQKPSHEKILNVSVIYQLREPGDIYLHPLPWT